MDNVFSQGSQYAHLPGPPCNEDYSMTMVVVSSYGEIISATKIWDEDSAKIFYARKIGENQPAVGEYVVFHRIGEGNRDTGEDFLCFAYPGFLWILDNGDGTGTAGNFDGTGTFVEGEDDPLTLATADPVTRFHDSAPPYLAGRIYAGIRSGNSYVVFLAGYGDGEKIFVATSAGVTFTLTCDHSGKVIDFETS